MKRRNKVVVKTHTAFGFCLVIAVAGLIIYANSFFVPFLFDDKPLLLGHSFINYFWQPWKIFGQTSRPFLYWTFIFLTKILIYF